MAEHRSAADARSALEWALERGYVERWDQTTEQVGDGPRRTRYRVWFGFDPRFEPDGQGEPWVMTPGMVFAFTKGLRRGRVMALKGLTDDERDEFLS